MSSQDMPARSIISAIVDLSSRGFPFTLVAPTTPIERLRAFGARNAYDRHARWVRYASRAAMTLLWPIGAFASAIRTIRRLPAEDNVPVLRAFLAMYRAALLHNIPPQGFRGFRLYRAERQDDLHHYMFTRDGSALLALNRRRGADERDVQDKFRFAEICAAHGLPHVATLAAFRGHRQLTPGAPFVPTAERLFVKDLYGSGGEGVVQWEREGGRYVSSEGQRVDASALAAVLSARDCIVQPVMTNHPALEGFTHGALATVRMITAASGAGRSEFIGALLNLPTYGLATIGIMGVVDADSGGLTFAVDLRAHRQIESFPGSNRLFSALTLPFWRESVALVERAHGLAFPRFSSLGWDVALTPDKAVLLETNAGWNTRYHQRMNGPLGRSRFSPLVDDMLRQIGC